MATESFVFTANGLSTAYSGFRWINFVLNKAGLAAIIASISGLSSHATEWEPDPNAYISDLDRAKVSLSLFGLQAVGVDEHRVTFNPPGYPTGSLVTTEIGNREVIVNVYAEAYDYTLEAAEIVDFIRTGIRADAVTAQLNSINLAFEWMAKTTKIPAVRNERALSAASADIRFGGIARLSTFQVNGWVDFIDGTPIAAAIIPGTLNP